MAQGLFNGSVIRIINALSPIAIAAAGSSNPVNLAGYEGAMLIASTGSAPGVTGAVFQVQRSGTSNGTFATIASAQGQPTNNTVVTRSFKTNSSAVWHRVHYTNGAGGSMIVNLELLAFHARYEPVVTQEAGVVVLSDVLSG